VRRKARPELRRRRPRVATIICVGLTLAVAVNVALRDGPHHARASRPADTTGGAETTSAALGAPAPDRNLVAAIQRELEAKGYAPGSETGELTLPTRAAVLAFETDIGRPLTGVPSEAILKELLFGATIVAKGLGQPKVTGEGARLVREIEARLAQAGLEPGAVDGKLDASTAKAIARFEALHGMRQSGRIGGALAQRLLAVEGS
jgi:peptidoglycan hydrolase-like protein with peptidoglycan-binding domain